MNLKQIEGMLAYDRPVRREKCDMRGCQHWERSLYREEGSYICSRSGYCECHKPEGNGFAPAQRSCEGVVY